MYQAGFNPKARWDRNLPEASDDNNPADLNEKIEVFAWFKTGKAYPKAFIWKGKLYRVDNITYNWQERCGSQILNHFTLTCGDNLYQISFNNTSLGWRFNKIIT
ncbi:MAG: hypothetical protein WC628_01365 [Candidatus Omnitrophota bacterium]